MSSDLHRENTELRRQLAELVARARHNEDVLKRFQQLELRLIGIVSFHELVEAVLHDYRKAFELDGVSLALIDSEYERRRMLAEAEVAPDAFPGLMFFDREQPLAALFEAGLRPLLARFDPARHGFLFPSRLSVPSSIAVLPLLRWGRLIGSLNLGSRKPDRFAPGMATNFIERLAAVAAICIENVLNNERLKHLGLTDALTGVHNRRYFDQRLREEIDRSLRKGQPLSCLLLDLDHFKSVNDRWGHQNGDLVLREVAERIKLQLRVSDAMARYGGEEFAVLLVQTGESTALSIAERIREAIAAEPLRLLDGQSAALTLSIGSTTLHMARREPDLDAVARRLVSCADQALYQAKQQGRNKVRVAPFA
jgi:diguanylate cyclase (GGDEF)-like protein